MALPEVGPDDVRRLFPQIAELGAPLNGGQKLVYPCVIDGQRYALKLLLSEDNATDEESGEGTRADEALARAQREVGILRDCDSLHLPKLGPIDLCLVEANGQTLITFSEEFIQGESLDAILARDGRLNTAELLQLAMGINEAIAEIWRVGKIHRDIKPSNIMRRADGGNYVLLDAGIAFDVYGTAITLPGGVPRTPGFVAPELLNPAGKREADCRADHFLLGIVLYIAATGRHPFVTRRNQPEGEIIANIVQLEPAAPRALNDHLSEGFSDVIVRLLRKKRHARFRTCDQLSEHLAACREGRA